jgi:hypothetical protein
MDAQTKSQIQRTILNVARNDSSCKCAKALCYRVRSYHPNVSLADIRKLVAEIGKSL